MSAEAKVGRHQLRVQYHADGRGAQWACAADGAAGGGPKIDVERAIYAHLGIEYSTAVNRAVAAARDAPDDARAQATLF